MMCQIKLNYQTAITIDKHSSQCQIYRSGRIKFYTMTPSSRKRVIKMAAALPFHQNKVDCNYIHWCD